MAIKVRRDGALQTITRLRVMQGGAMRDVRTVKVMEGDTLRTVASFISTLSATANGSFFGIQATSSSSPIYVATNAVTVTPAGGAAPFSYVWTQTSGESVTITSDRAATTTISAILQAGSYFGDLQCAVTDSLGTTVNVSVPFNFEIVDNA